MSCQKSSAHSAIIWIDGYREGFPEEYAACLTNPEVVLDLGPFCPHIEPIEEDGECVKVLDVESIESWQEFSEKPEIATSCLNKLVPDTSVDSHDWFFRAVLVDVVICNDPPLDH